MQSKTCCIIGYQDIPADKKEGVWDKLEGEVLDALDDGYSVFITEFSEIASGLFLQWIDQWREMYPDIFWEVILPRLDQAQKFNREKGTLLSKVSGLKFLCPKCGGEYPLSVTRYMLEQSSRVIAVPSSDDDRDTLYAMDYAKTMERDLRIINFD